MLNEFQLQEYQAFDDGLDSIETFGVMLEGQLSLLSLLALHNGEKLSTIREVRGTTFLAINIFRTSQGLIQIDLLTDYGL